MLQTNLGIASQFRSHL